MTIGDRELERYGEGFLQTFEAIRRALALYPSNHPNVIDQLNRFLRNLNELRLKVGDTTFNVARGEFYINGAPLKRISITYQRNLAAWEKMGLGLVRFDSGATVESILRFFEVIGRPLDEADSRGGVAAALERAGVKGIRASRVVAELATEDDPAVAEPVPGHTPTDVAEARSRFRDSIGAFGQIVERAKATAGSADRILRSLAKAVEARLFERRAVRELGRQLEKHDEESWRHALGGALVAVLIGDGLGLDRDRLTLLGEAAFLRDIGLTEVSPAALRNRRIDPQADAAFRTHPGRGAKLLLGQPDIDPSAAIVALEHHSRFDLKGFPRLRAVRGQHALSRIVAVASDYDLWTGGYAGERTLEPAAAVRELVQGAGSVHDASAVRSLLRFLGSAPEGTAVKLRDGSYGLVAGIGARSWLAPPVALLRDGSGGEIPPGIVETDSLAPAGETAVVAASSPTPHDIERLRPLRDQT